MGNSTLTISETRLLPGAIAFALVVLAALVTISDAPIGVRVAVVSGMLLAAIWPFYRCVKPRWVLRLDEGKLLFHDLSSKCVTEVDLATITELRLKKKVTFGVGADGGIGFQNELVLATQSQTVILPLPFLQHSAAKTLETVKAHLPVVLHKR